MKHHAIITVALAVVPDDRCETGFEYRCVEKDRTWLLPDSAVILCEKDIEIEYPEFDELTMRLKAIDHLKDKIEKERLAFAEREMQLQRQINALLLLEHKPVVEDAVFTDVSESTNNNENSQEEN